MGQIYVQPVLNQTCIPSLTRHTQTCTHIRYVRVSRLCTAGAQIHVCVDIMLNIYIKNKLCARAQAPKRSTPMRLLLLELGHTEFQIDLLGTGHTLWLPNNINDPKKQRQRKTHIKNPIKIIFVPRNSLCSHFSPVINSMSTAFLCGFAVCLSLHLISQSILDFFFLIHGFLSLQALSPCLVSILLSLHLSPLSPKS